MYRFLFLVTLILTSCSNQPAPNDNLIKTNPEIANGKTLFYTKCASCHMVNNDLTGPALKGAESRWPTKQLLYGYIKNSSSVIDTMPYAKELWKRYNQTQMTLFPELTDSAISDILAYVKSVEKVP